MLTQLDLFIQKITDQKKQIAIGSSAVLGGIVILIAYFQSGPSALSYAKAQKVVAAWEASPLDEKLYRNMREAIQHVPALGERFEASIAQTLLNTEKVNEALSMANRSLNRVKEEAPFHVAYAKTSLLIEQGQFQKALENTVALKELMGPSYLLEDKGGALLYFHNLLRIACLQQELKNMPGEKAAWEELENLLLTNKEMGSVILSSFSENTVGLLQYIQDRKKSLL
jgi:hypothetical protein